MNAIYSFKQNIIEALNLNEQKIWLSEKQGPRVECIFTLGKEQFMESEVIYEDDAYILFGQNIDEELKERILKEVTFNE